MNMVPILERELLVRARRPLTQWGRVMVGGMAVFWSLQFFILWGGSSANLSQNAGYAFQTMAWMGWIVSAGGFLLTADCLSAERRAGTLGLLLLTRVRLLEVLGGKLMAHGITAAFWLVGLTPMLMLPVLAGGVTVGQVAGAALGWGAMLWFSLCLGLWVSSGSWRLVEALRKSGVWFVIIVTFPLLFAALQSFAGAGAWASVLRTLSPAAAFLDASQPRAGLVTPLPLICMVVSVAWGALFVILSVMRLRGSARENLAGAESGSMAVVPATRRRGPRNLHPLQWLLRRDKPQTWALWLAAILGSAGLISNLLLVRLGGISAVGIIYAVNFLGALGSAALFAWAGARFFSGARASGELELLSTTPVGSSELIRSVWSVLRHRMIWPWLLMVLVGVVRSFSHLFMPGLIGGGSFVGGLRSLVGLAANALGPFALVWLGMYFGLRSRSGLSALLWPVGLVWGLDLILTYGVYLAVGLLYSAVRGGLGMEVWMLMNTITSLIMAVKQVWLIVWARRRVNDAFVGGLIQPVDLRQTSLGMLAWIRRARHWTGGRA